MLLKPVSFLKKAAGGFHPSDLFAGGEDGFYINPGPSTSYTTADTTTAAGAGDAVQFQQDSSGIGTPRNLSQASATYRPLLDLTGGDYSLDFQGADRISTAAYTSAHATNGISLFARINLSTINTQQVIIGADDSSTRIFQFRVESGNTLSLIAWNNSNGLEINTTSTTTLSASTWYNVCAVFNSTNGRIWIDTMTDAGVENTDTNAVGTVKSTSFAVTVGERRPSVAAGGDDLNGLVRHALCINRSLTEAERGDLATYASNN